MLLGLGMESEVSSLNRFAEYLKNEVAKWATVVKATGLRLS